MLLNGIIGHLFGPWEGCNADSFLLRTSKLLETCAVRDSTDENMPTEEWFLQLFGDPAYGVSNQIISPFSGHGERTNAEMDWNAEMAAVQIEVEHGFSIVSNTWPFLNAGWKMHIFSSPIGRYYHAGVLFTNAINCLRYNQVAQYFDCKPPDLFDYFYN